MSFTHGLELPSCKVYIKITDVNSAGFTAAAAGTGECLRTYLIARR